MTKENPGWSYDRVVGAMANRKREDPCLAAQKFESERLCGSLGKGRLQQKHRKPARRYTALWPKNARNGSITFHHDQYPATPDEKRKPQPNPIRLHSGF